MVEAVLRESKCTSTSCATSARLLTVCSGLLRRNTTRQSTLCWH
jgi:hypothetical protein